MNRIIKHYRIQNPKQLKLQIVHWLNQFTICSFFDNHAYQHGEHQFELLASAGVVADTSNNDSLFTLDNWLEERNDWIFGHLNYTLKNQLFRGFTSCQNATIEFPDFYFFQPEIVCTLEEDILSIHSANILPDEVFNQIQAIAVHNERPPQLAVHFHPRMSKETYCGVIEQLLGHINRGDCYEMNFCTEWIAQQAQIDPVTIYATLSNISPSPFGAFYKLEDKYLLCSSPERFFIEKR